MKNTLNASKLNNPVRYKTPSDLVELIKKQNLELNRRNSELAQLNLDLQESFEALSELNIKLRAVNDELRMRNRIQAEFINIVAHELRTPTQSNYGILPDVNDVS